MAVKSGLPSNSLIANVRETSLSINGCPPVCHPARRPVSSTLQAAGSPTFLCRCPGAEPPPAAAAAVVPEPGTLVQLGGHLPGVAGPGCGPRCRVEALRPELAAILAEVRCVTRKLREDDWNDEQTSDWKFAAMVIDRLSFWTLTVYLVVVTVAVFGSVI